ncbi:MAG: DEAD/DEAH box helicase [Rhodospirillales bacterium]|jgi:hypothetical protein|nr:DEAD/DEAH box helicase [Rhodospirillales bacterium]
MSDYAAFLEHKTQAGADSGFEPVWMPAFLFDFQAALVEWAIRKGRAAIFADCGLGTTPMQLVWAENMAEKTGRRALILTPLAVAWQTVEEAGKFNLEAHYSKTGRPAPAGITVTNYERLHLFDPADYGAVVCDESSILKSFDGQRRNEITAFMRKMPYRLLCTATAAPNDYVELGTSSEALGYLGHMDMLNRFFVNDNSTSDTKGHWRGFHAPRAFIQQQWRFKGHAEDPFWRWVASWARALRRPSDFGFEDDGFILPPLQHRVHVIEARTKAEGTLFELPAIGLREERDEVRRTLAERCEAVAELVRGDRSAVVWCHLNEEGNRLARLIPDAVQVSGSDSLEAKEEAFHAFSKGEVRVLITKPKIGAWGLNWQHCAHMTFFPSHSYEQYYQAVRRSWRFGQKNPVTVDIVTTEGGRNALDNLKRKADQADRMFDRLVAHMSDALHIERGVAHEKAVEVPAWLS